MGSTAWSAAVAIPLLFNLAFLCWRVYRLETIFVMLVEALKGATVSTRLQQFIDAGYRYQEEHKRIQTDRTSAAEREMESARADLLLAAERLPKYVKAWGDNDRRKPGDTEKPTRRTGRVHGEPESDSRR